MATSEASKSSRGRPAGDYQVSPARSDDLPPLDPTLALENLSSRRTRSPIVANGTVSALVDQLDRALHDHSSVDAFLELDEQLPPTSSCFATCTTSRIPDLQGPFSAPC